VVGLAFDQAENERRLAGQLGERPEEIAADRPSDVPS
jgi:hypothetical protein